jgi:ABC-2 type transport system permease protein
MRTVAALVKKEMIQVIRDRNMLRLIFVMPLIQLLVLGYAVNTDVKKINTAIYDNDRTELSREYVRSFTPGGYFIEQTPQISLGDVALGLKENQYAAALIIPSDFSRQIGLKQPVTVGFLVDGSNANSAAISVGYAGLITAQFNQNLIGRTAAAV